MAIRIECPERTCAKSLKVKEELAGKRAKCPACGTSVKIPAPAAGPAPDPPAAGVNPERTASAPAAPVGLWAAIERQCQEHRLDGLSRNLLAGGLLALFFLALSTIFSWLSISTRFGDMHFAASISGIQTGTGAMIFLFSLAAGGFGVFAFFQKPAWFPLSVRVAAAWGGLTFLFLLVHLFRAGSIAGFGLYLGVLAALGAGGPLGVFALRQLNKK